MSDLITDEIFTDAQQRIAASNMNGIIGRARVQPDIIANKVASATMDVADQLLVLKTDNTLAKARFDTIVNSTSSTLPVADATKNGMLKQLSGNASDYVGGDNACHPISSILPPGIVLDFAGPNIPTGWLKCDGSSQLRTTYPGLFAAIGTTYGSVDGTHFTLPNFTGRVAAGVGGSFGALAVAGGAASVALAIANLPSHSHPIADQQHNHGASASDSGHTHSYTSNLGGGATWPSGSNWTSRTDTSGVGYANISVSVAAAYSNINTTQAVGSGSAFAILPPFLCVYKVIKT